MPEIRSVINTRLRDLHIFDESSLTAVPSDMLFGVGLGCLVQMVKTQSDVQVISSNTQIQSV